MRLSSIRLRGFVGVHQMFVVLKGRRVGVAQICWHLWVFVPLRRSSDFEVVRSAGNDVVVDGEFLLLGADENVETVGVGAPRREMNTLHT